MAKPWARLEIGYLGHPKFLALSANAICLWHEGKNYCDEFHTDGLIPRDALKLFRFRGAKAMQQLTTPCATPKPDGSAYAALWEEHPVGFKMHDYLDHNDCREEVLARLEDADERREHRRLKNKERQAAFRIRRHQEAETWASNPTEAVASSGAVTPRNADRNALRNACVTAVTQTPTETLSVPSTTSLVKNTKEVVPPPRYAPLHRTHKQHAHCGRVCLHASLYDEFVRRRNHPSAAKEIDDWCMEVEREWGDDGPHAHDEPGDAFDFWKARYAERWPAASVKAKVETGPKTVSAREHRYAQYYYPATVAGAK